MIHRNKFHHKRQYYEALAKRMWEAGLTLADIKKVWAKLSKHNIPTIEYIMYHTGIHVYVKK